ncbi:MAG: patatin-like phospholipase family protein, partial [Bdellovibrionales bacterium]|nr:patatin-like phospholipase family protein [Oligoflexia bacterium]
MGIQDKTALVLTGGGARAAYQVGVLRALGEILPGTENPFPIISGTSAGAINAGFLAARLNDWDAAVNRLHELWLSLTLEDIYRTSGVSLSQIAWDWLKRILFGTFLKKQNQANFLLDTSPLRKLLETEMDFEAIRANFLDQSLTGLSFSALDYATGETVSFFHDSCERDPWLRSGRMGVRTDLNAEHVMASSAIPIFFPPVRIHSSHYGDGSLRQTAPLSPAIHMGAERIVAVSIRYEKKRTNDNDDEALPPHAPSLAEISGQLMNSLFLDSLDADLERLKRMNIEAEHYPEGGMKVIPVLVLKPSRSLEELLPNLLERFPAGLRFLLRGLGVSSNQ